MKSCWCYIHKHTEGTERFLFPTMLRLLLQSSPRCPTRGCSSRKAGGRALLQGEQRLVRSMINSSASDWEQFPVEQAGQKVTSFFCIAKLAEDCWAFFSQHLHLP